MNPLDELHALTSVFPTDLPLFRQAVHIPSSTTPEPYRTMLVHEHHMTLAMEQYHGGPATVEVLDRKLEGDVYSRMILLRKPMTEEPIQFGLVRFNFQYVTGPVREEILAEQIPLGRVLIQHNVLRHIDLGAILEVSAGPGLARLLQMPEGALTYGRLATIFCNRQPAVDLLEISAPLHPR